jgi:YHS domain-containing protein
MRNTVLAFCFLLPTAGFAQKKPVAKPAVANHSAVAKYEVRGVVTYFFNSNYGYKPDVGATAYITKDGALPKDSLDAGAAEAYRSANVIYSLSRDPTKSSGLPGEESPKDVYVSARLRVIRLQRRLEENPTTSKVTADGQGIFLKKLPPGSYWILIASANRAHSVKMQKVAVVDDDIEVSAKFEAD